jgi:hypothetical protein
MAALLWTAPAVAETHGIVVRLDTGGARVAGPIIAHLKLKGGASSDIELNDEGSPPDVVAGDTNWSGAAWLDGDEFDVTITAGGKDYPGGRISWKAEDKIRDLVVHLGNGSITMEASVAGTVGTDGNVSGPARTAGPTGEAGLGGGGATGGGGDVSKSPSGPATEAGPTGQKGTGGGGTGGQGPGPGGAGGAPSGGPTLGEGAPVGGRPSAVTLPTGGSAGPTLFIALGAGLLMLVGLAWLWMRSRGDGPVSRPKDLQALPELGVLGPGSPSLSDGLALWVCPAQDDAALARAILATLARHHRVLYVGPAADAPPQVHGGPVYRVPANRPGVVGDAAESLMGESERPLAVFIHAQAADAGNIRDYADLLPPGAGGVVLVNAELDVPLPRIACARTASGWAFEFNGATIHASEGLGGLDPAA